MQRSFLLEGNLPTDRFELRHTTNTHCTHVTGTICAYHGAITFLTFNIKITSDSLFSGHVQKNEDRIDEALDPNLVSVVGAPDQKTKVVLKRVPVIARGHVIEIAAIESGAVQRRETGIQEAITQKKEDRCVKEVLIIKESRG